MRSETADLLKKASRQAIYAIKASEPAVAAHHQALSMRFSAEALMQLADDDRDEGASAN